MKNSARKGPRILERSGISCGWTSSILTMGNGGALLLIRNDPESPDPSHELCSPKENCMLLILSETVLLRSWIWFTCDVPLARGGVPSAAAMADRAAGE